MRNSTLDMDLPMKLTKLDFFLTIGFGLTLFLVTGMNRVIAAESPSLENSDPNRIIQWTRKIYSNGKWNGSPDISYWRGHYYVAINQGALHAGENDPAIVLRSADLQQWDPIHTTDTNAVDCRLLALPDRLIFYYVYMNRPADQGPDTRNYAETRATYTDDGEKWTSSQRIYLPLQNLWQPAIHNGVIYVASDFFEVSRSDYVTATEETTPHLCRIDLLRSTDGLKWEKISTILKGNRHFNVTETSLVFRPDGELWAITRQNFFSHSQPPYTSWKNRNAGIIGGGIAGPSVITIGSDVYVAGRYYGYLKDHGPADTPQTNKFATSIWKLSSKAEKFQRIADLPTPSFSDLGYNGFVKTKDGVFILYYSGHEYGETQEARNSKADIFLAKLNLEP